MKKVKWYLIPLPIVGMVVAGYFAHQSIQNQLMAEKSFNDHTVDDLIDAKTGKIYHPRSKSEAERYPITAPNNGANSNITIYPGVYYEANVKIVSAPNDDTAHYYDILHDTVLNIQNGKMVYIYWVKKVPEWNGNPDTFELDILSK